MTFTSKKEFIATMFALNENKLWSLIAKMPMLSTRFVDEASKIKKTNTISFKKMVVTVFGLILLGMLLMFYVKHNVASPSPSDGTKFLTVVGFFAGLLSLVIAWVESYSYITGEWNPDYENESYIRRIELSKKVAATLESEKTRVQKRIEYLNTWRKSILEIESVDAIKSTILGENANNNSHFIYYMQDENIVKYWNEVEKVRILTEETKEQNELTAHIEQLEKEIEFCNNIK